MSEKALGASESLTEKTIRGLNDRMQVAKVVETHRWCGWLDGGLVVVATHWPCTTARARTES
jgi:hypothetical protein